MFAALLLFAISISANAQFWNKPVQELLPADEAFTVVAEIDQSGVLKVHWSIADDYYMYRDQFGIESATPGISVGQVNFPEGVVEDDPEFGEVVVYFYNVQLSAPLSGNSESGKLDLILKGQGCNKPVGVCYPPQTRKTTLELPSGINFDSNVDQTSKVNGTRDGTKQPRETIERSFFSYVISAFLAGVLLSFTPCVLPMIPILAGVIAGQKNPSKMRSGWLAIAYVAGTVVTYIAAGAIAGATGAQLQAYFQNVWVISAICALLVLLAASLFGWYKIQLPSSIQSKLSGTQVSTKSATFSSFGLGLISALVVGACVSPILILALGAAITQGDPVLGAAIMGSMAVGMGLLLILFGFGAGWILPKAGAWMNHVQILFGFMVLGVAIYLLSTLPFIPTLYLWSALLLSTGFYIWHLGSSLINANDTPLFASASKAMSAMLIAWGVMALVGGSTGGKDILQPLESLSFSNNATLEKELPFNVTTTVSQVQALMQSAKQAKQPVLIDFYADWCLDCTRMQRTTFKRASVHQALQGWTLIEINVTETNDDSEQVKKYFNVFGPPATLFIEADGQERQDLRQYGYIKELEFLSLIEQVSR